MLYANPDQHAENPPQSWRVQKFNNRLWLVVDLRGTTIERATTKREAERLRLEGFCAKLWEDERRWFAGESVPGWKPYAAAGAGT